MTLLPKNLASLILLSLGTIAAMPALAVDPAFETALFGRERADRFNAYFFPRGVPSGHSLLNTPAQREIPGVRNIKTLIPGVFYRAGGPGGQVPVSSSSLKALCEAGFSVVVYLYPTGFRRQDVACTYRGTPHTLRYRQHDFIQNSDKYESLVEVKAVLEDPSKGPVMVHCWNGYHASGEVGASGLIQFCGWSGQAATDYWWKNQHGAAVPTRRLKAFTRYADLKISSEIANELCIAP